PHLGPAAHRPPARHRWRRGRAAAPGRRPAARQRTPAGPRGAGRLRRARIAGAGHPRQPGTERPRHRRRAGRPAPGPGQPPPAGGTGSAARRAGRTGPGLEAEGRTLSWLLEISPQPRVLGLFAFGDSLKEGAAAGVAALQRRGIHTHLISGDNRGSAESVAKQLGIEQVHAEVLPADKAAEVARLKAGGAGVAMVGDGINDAPALAAADVGIAMGGGTDVAMHAAAITLMRGDPRLVPAALEISRRTYAKIRQNLFWAFIYNLIGLPLAALG